LFSILQTHFALNELEERRREFEKCEGFGDHL